MGKERFEFKPDKGCDDPIGCQISNSCLASIHLEAEYQVRKDDLDLDTANRIVSQYRCQRPEASRMKLKLKLASNRSRLFPSRR